MCKISLLKNHACGLQKSFRFLIRFQQRKAETLLEYIPLRIALLWIPSPYMQIFQTNEGFKTSIKITYPLQPSNGRYVLVKYMEELQGCPAVTPYLVTTQ